MKATEIYELWTRQVDDEKILKQLNNMRGNPTAIENAFYKDLEFGTGGLRGEIGAGTNCLNIYTIRKVTQGIADCMTKYGQKTAAISYDSRINSDLFAATAAEVLAYNGIRCYLVKELMPTPFLSYLTRFVKADIGIMITASHNPSKYNGYKVYGSDGCQLTDARATEMIGFINPVDPFKVKSKPLQRYIDNGAVQYADDSIVDSYLNEVKKQRVNFCENLKIVYTPLNGTGYKLVPRILKETGADDLIIVEEQGYPDGNFTTCSYPNPEKPEALAYGLKYAERFKADILLATDPDADRLGIAVRHKDEYKLMTGNEVGALLTDYLFKEKSAKGTLPKNPVVVKTIVTSPLGEKIAKKYGAEVFDVLTGFKYIGDVIGKLEKKGEEQRFVIGFEESYGYLAGSYVRDKDAVVASMLVAEMAAFYKKQGKTLVDIINGLYAEYGTYEHKLVSFEFAGAEGNAKMKKLLSNLRQNLPVTFAGQKIIDTIDYSVQTRFDLPKADVITFMMEDGSILIIRPSGTEPLIKTYLTVSKTPEINAKSLEKMTAELKVMFG